MPRFLKAPIFYVSVLLSALYFLGAIDITKALNSPSGNPPAGGAVLSANSPPANTLYFTSSGFVGIGTTTPQQQLTISSSSDNLVGLSRIGATSSAAFKMNTSGDFIINFSKATLGCLFANGCTPAQFTTSYTAEDLVTLKSGRLGIGTTNPTGVLSVSGGGIIIDGAPQGGKKHSRLPLNNTITTVEGNGDQGWHSSLTIGADGLPVISHTGTGTDLQQLKIVRCADIACSSNGTVSIVDTGASFLYTSIGIATDTFPIVAYYDNTSGDLEFVKCGNAGCTSGNTTSSVDTIGDVGRYVSLALGTDGLPVISYYDNTNKDLKVAKCGNSTCGSGNTITVVDSGISAVTAGPNNPATSTNNNSTGTIAWTSFSNVLASDDSYANIQPKVSGNEGPLNPSIGTSNASTGTLTWFSPGNIYSSDNAYATSTSNNPGEATEYLTASGFNFAIPSSASINGIKVEFERFKNQSGGDFVDNAVRIIKGGFIGVVDKSSSTAWTTSETYYSYGGSSDLWGETWTPSDINASNFGAALSVKCTSSCNGRMVSVDNVRITVYYTEGGVSNYITATNFGFSVPSGATINGIKAEIERKQNGGTLVDNAVRIIRGGAIGTSEHASTTAWSGTEAYYSYGGSSDLWGDTWTYSDINSSNFGVALSVKCTSDCGSASGDVDHIRVTVYYTVTADVGQYSAIAMNPDGKPSIAYYDLTNGYLKYVRCGNASCGSGNTITTIDATSTVGQYVSMTIGNDSLPIIAYYDSTNRDLKVIHCGNLTCDSGNTITAVDSTGVVGRWSSIAIGADGLPVISYEDGGGLLKVARCGDISCSANNSAAVVDSSGIVGDFSSIAVGVDGLPIISYFSRSLIDLKVAHCGSENCIPYWTRR